MNELALEVSNLTKRFPASTGLLRRRSNVHAVDDVSFSLRRGAITALVGESGSGKSTVARLLARLYVPTSARSCSTAPTSHGTTAVARSCATAPRCR